MSLRLTDVVREDAAKAVAAGRDDVRSAAPPLVEEAPDAPTTAVGAATRRRRTARPTGAVTDAADRGD
jgi:hypothetical protein